MYLDHPVITQGLTHKLLSILDGMLCVLPYTNENVSNHARWRNRNQCCGFWGILR